MSRDGWALAPKQTVLLLNTSFQTKSLQLRKGLLILLLASRFRSLGDKSQLMRNMLVSEDPDIIKTADSILRMRHRKMRITSPASLLALDVPK